MKVFVQYNLPDDEDEYKRAVNGRLYYLALCDIEALIRRKLKYGFNLGENEETVCEEIRALLPGELE